MKPSRLLLRVAVTAFQQIRRMIWYVWPRKVRGVLAVALTGEGRVVLVRLTYARGWHLPGGGIKRRETPAEAVRRELREEIGLERHGEIVEIEAFEHRPDHRRGTITLFLVRDVIYAPRRSIEIERIEAFDPARLPDDIQPLAGAKIARALARS